ncbi:hypothetical protein [Kineosporia succinea]|uniref:DUF3558 domain-containing protein n=1 Tax=Kineosporia succinea TaxID=84632 RepID=A0ABT9PBE0_9ACTN|nr:hypothetical protein [Kineosporia succinea]MDP9830023.1 hypothetical protein [Kineosporia succinea]
MAPQHGKSLVALLGVTGLLGVGLLATRGLVDGAAAGDASVVAAVMSPVAADPAADVAEGTPQCSLLTFAEITSVTGGEVGYDPDPDSFYGDVCWWRISDSQQVPPGTLLSVAQTQGVQVKAFTAYADQAVRSGDATRLSGLGEQAIVNEDGEVEVFADGSSYRVGFTIDGSRPPVAQLRAMQEDLAREFVPAANGSDA